MFEYSNFLVMHEIDPHITVDQAIRFAGNQVKLANILKLSKSTVNEWVSSNREFIPPLPAYRLDRYFPDNFG